MLNELYLKLAGDGIHDDTDAIQALLDSGYPEIRLPEPKVCYLISKTLRIHSNTSLILGSTTRILLADHGDCHMIANAEPDARHIRVEGGIWDMNNRHQTPNCMRVPPAPGEDPVVAFVMSFNRVTDLRISSLTIKDPVIFSITLEYVTYFTVRDVTFDFNYGNPNATNMDGVHLNGGCRFGHISNLQGPCYDDMVALNADEGVGGPIEDIEIDGLFCSDCHSAVRILTRGQWVRRVHISNVFGTFFQYAVGITRYSDEGTVGRCDQISLSNIYASKAVRIPIYGKGPIEPATTYVYDILWIEGGIEVGNVQVSNLHRRENVTAIPTVHLLAGTHIELLSIEHCSQENETGKPVPFFLNEGTIDKLFLRDIQVKGDETLVNKGSIGEIFADEDVARRLSQ